MTVFACDNGAGIPFAIESNFLSCLYGSAVYRFSSSAMEGGGRGGGGSAGREIIPLGKKWGNSLLYDLYVRKRSLSDVYFINVLLRRLVLSFTRERHYVV